MGLFNLSVFVRISLGDVWVTSRTRVGRSKGTMGFWQVLWVSRQRFSQVVARVRLLMLPVLEGPGVGSIYATASARDPVMIGLVLLQTKGKSSPSDFDLLYTVYKKRRQLTHFPILKPQKPRSSRALNKRI